MKTGEKERYPARSVFIDFPLSRSIKECTLGSSQTTANEPVLKFDEREKAGSIPAAITFGAIAQTAERRICNAIVGSATLPGSTNFRAVIGWGTSPLIENNPV